MVIEQLSEKPVNPTTVPTVTGNTELNVEGNIGNNVPWCVLKNKNFGGFFCTSAV